MPNLIIDNLDEELMTRLERYAGARSQTIADAARDIIARTLPPRAVVADELAKIRAMTPPGPQTDSADIIRRLRDGQPDRS